MPVLDRKAMANIPAEHQVAQRGPSRPGRVGAVAADDGVLGVLQGWEVTCAGAHDTVATGASSRAMCGMGAEAEARGRAGDGGAAPSGTPKAPSTLVSEPSSPLL